MENRMISVEENVFDYRARLSSSLMKSNNEPSFAQWRYLLSSLVLHPSSLCWRLATGIKLESSRPLAFPDSRRVPQSLHSLHLRLLQP